MKVTNIGGTRDKPCTCGSWLLHWQRYGGVPGRPCCSVANCTAPIIVGAHVQRDGAPDRSWYIVPLCTGHNAKAPALTIRNDAILVSASVGETCGKG